MTSVPDLDGYLPCPAGCDEGFFGDGDEIETCAVCGGLGLVPPELAPDAEAHDAQ